MKLTTIMMLAEAVNNAKKKAKLLLKDSNHFDDAAIILCCNYLISAIQCSGQLSEILMDTESFNEEDVYTKQEKIKILHSLVLITATHENGLRRYVSLLQN